MRFKKILRGLLFLSHIKNVNKELMSKGEYSMKNIEENKYKNPIMEHYEVDWQMNLSKCMQAMQIQRKLTIIKGALIIRVIL